MARSKCIAVAFATALSAGTALSGTALSDAALSAVAALSIAAAPGCSVTTSGQLTTRTATRPVQPPVTWRTENPAPQVGASPAQTTPANATDESGMYDSKGFLIRRAPVEDPNRRIFRTIKHDELASLLGLTAEQARQRLKEIGHTGTVHVTTNWQEVPNCAPERVCWTEPHDGVDSNGGITLVLNKKYTPPPPPPPP